MDQTPDNLPWRRTLAGWPDAWRGRWGRLAAERAREGLPWPADEAEAFRRVVAERARGEAPEPPPRPLARWACPIVYCLRKTGWWRSRHGVVLCLNCQPPTFPADVVAAGGPDEAPLVRGELSRVAVDPEDAGRPDRPRSLRDALAVGASIYILRGGGLPEKVVAKENRRKLELPADATDWACEGDLQWTPISPADRELSCPIAGQAPRTR